jgi:hypothetical protein
MYYCARGINFASFNDLSIGIRTCSDSMLFFVFHFITMSDNKSVDIQFSAPDAFLK